MTKSEEALQVFSGDLNCSQSVLSVFHKEAGISPGQALKMATSFGGGMRKGQVCGAVTGALMALGLKFGMESAGDLDEKSLTYDLTEQFMTDFEARMGSTLCKGILGYDLSDPEDKITIESKNLYNTVCPAAVETAVKMVEEIMEQQAGR